MSDNYAKQISGLSPRAIADNLDTFMENETIVNIDSLVAQLSAWDIINNLDLLLKYGATLDMEKIMTLPQNAILTRVDTLTECGYVKG